MIFVSQGSSDGNTLIELAGIATHGSNIPKPKNWQHMKNLKCLLALNQASMKDGDNLHGVEWLPYVVDNGDYWTVYCGIDDWGKGRNGYYFWNYTVLYIITYDR